nr:carboxypeptidase regulatory-like domain-containing protein [Edaphobacter lichenicola]
MIATATILLVTHPMQSAAQLSTASVNGVIRDQSGAVIPGATVILRNVDTAVAIDTKTNTTGTYGLFNITPGHYTIEVQSSGFSPKKDTTFTLEVSQVATFDFVLTVGSQSSEVTVSSSNAQIDTTTANLGTVITGRQVNDLPLNGRNFTQLLLLTPGVSGANPSQNAGGYTTAVALGSSFSFPAVNGQTNRSNYFLTDGMNNYGTFFSTYAVPPIIDAIQEFKIVSHTDDAEFGSVLGGVVNVVTKSGTNTLHGSAWEYARNAIFDARTYFLPPTAAKAQFHQNQFGGSIGGPVVVPKVYDGRNKTFFFGAYQGFRYLQTSNTPLRVPTAAQLSGDESSWPTQLYNPYTTKPDPAHPGQFIRDAFPGNQLGSFLDPRMVAYAQFVFPMAGPVFDGAGDNAIDTTPVTQEQNEFNVRIDHTFRNGDTAFFRYSFIDSNVNSSGGQPGLPNVTATPARNWGGSYVHVFSPTLVSQVQYARTTVQLNSTTRFDRSTSAIISQVGFSPSFVGQFTAVDGSLLPGPGIANFTGGSGENVNYNPGATNSYQISGSVTKVAGRNVIRLGGGYISAGYATLTSGAQLGFAAQQTGNTNPLDTVNAGDPLASFLINVPNYAEHFNRESNTRPGGVLSAFAQDTWKASDRLTLNLGVRYDVTFIPPFGTESTAGKQGGIETGDVNFNNGTYVLQKLSPPCNVTGVAPCIPGDGTLPANVVVDPRGKIAFNSYNNVGPRFGFAYRIGEKSALKGGFGIVYDNWAAVTQTSQNIGGGWPDVGQQLANNINQPNSGTTTPTVQSQNPFNDNGNSALPGPTPFNQVGFFYDPHLKDPYSEQWNLGAERQLDSSTTVEINYVGSVSKRLGMPGYYNTALLPGSGNPQSRALYPYIAPTYYSRSVGAANYNAFQFSLNRRFNNGLAYQVAYTWSKAMNVGGDDLFQNTTVPTDPYNPAAYGNYSVSGFDLTNILSVNAVYQIPVGRGQRLSTGSHVADYILGNWQFNNIFQAHSGLPFTPYISSDIANTGNLAQNEYEHANIVGNPNKITKRTSAEFFNTAAYVAPAGFTFGTASRNSLRSAGYWGLDSSIFRLFPVGGEREFEFRIEAFNLLNNVVLGQPNNDLNSGMSFGTVNTTANSSRVLQLALKYLF